MGQTPEEPATGNGTVDKLLKQINVPTLLAIVAMNGWGIGAINQNGHEREAQIQQAVREIHALHEALNDDQERSKATIERITTVLDGQGEQLSNQTKMLQNQQEILNELKTRP